MTTRERFARITLVMMSKDIAILERAIERAGGVGALAALLGVRQNAVSMWRIRRRVPQGWAAYLGAKLDDPSWPELAAPTGQPDIHSGACHG